MRALVVLALLALPISQEEVAAAERVGEFELGSTVSALLSGPSLESFARLFPADQPLEWSVYVPASYDSALPAGLLVYISPSDSGGIPEEWKPIMERRNLIWIGAHRSGNTVSTSLRIAYALLAPVAMEKRYTLDAERVYLSGLSGGGRVSSIVAPDYAHIFKGAIYNCGADSWSGERPERHEEMKANHYVFITGTRDFNLRSTKNAYRAYEKAGIANIKLMVIPRMAHRNPRAPDYERAIEYLDSRIEN